MYRFVLRLAIHWGCPPSEIYDKLSSREISELMIYDSLHPFGDRRLGLEVAHLARAIAHGGLKDPSGELTDYLLFDTPTLEPAEETKSVDEIKEEQLRLIKNMDLIFGL